MVKAALFCVASAVLSGCSHQPPIVGTWKHRLPEPNPGNVTMFTTFNKDGTFHTEGRDSDRGQPISRSRGTFTLNGGQLTEDIDRQGAEGQKDRHDRKVWTVAISGDTMLAVADPKLERGPVAWHRVN